MDGRYRGRGVNSSPRGGRGGIRGNWNQNPSNRGHPPGPHPSWLEGNRGSFGGVGEGLLGSRPDSRASIASSNSSFGGASGERSFDRRRSYDHNSNRGQSDRGRGWSGNRSNHHGPRNGPNDCPFENADGGRKYPMGFRQLEELQNKEVQDVIYTISNDKSGFPLLLADPKTREDYKKMKLILRVLAVALDSQGFDSSLMRAIGKIIESKFLDSLMTFNLSTLTTARDQQAVDQILSDQAVIFERIINISPSGYALNLQSAVNSARFVIGQSSARVSEVAVESLTRSHATLEELMASHSGDPESGFLSRNERVRRQLEAQHELDAPEDFRELSVVPTVEELVKIEKPFVRSNVTRGRYKDHNHYLDVQFRLMKEDFVCPLREGIRDVMNSVSSDGSLGPSRKRFQDVRIYKDGMVTDVTYERSGVTLKLHFSVNEFKKVRWEITKRLMFGSLLCFTHDGFKSVMFASVADRKPEEMAKGIIKIRPESHQLEINAWTGKQFLIIESQAFFEAYRHFLSSLQKIQLQRYPLKKYIVDVHREVELPMYLAAAENTEAAEIPLSHLSTHEGLELYGNPFHKMWPSAANLGLDEAQYRAFQAGLTRAFALIQGPPGTGKTFIGLKLVETILRRRRRYHIADEGPIFVVCFTNHALDQFLEGMLKFTDKMLRIGGQCKNENLKRFSPREVQRQFAGQRIGAHDVFQMQREISFSMKRIELAVAEDKILRDGISSGYGLLNRAAILEIDPGVNLPEYFSAVSWLGLDQERPREFPEQFVGRLKDEERRYVEARLAPGQRNAVVRRFAGDDSDDEDPEVGANGGGNEEDALDLEIEDEVAFEQRQRDVESFYDTADAAPAKPTDADSKNCLNSVMEISEHSLEQRLNQANSTMATLNNEFLEKQRQVEAGKLKARELELWQASNRQVYYEAFISVARAEALSESLKAAQPLLQVPTSFDLERPEDQLPASGDVFNAPYKARWRLYRYWANRYARMRSKKMNERMEDYKALCGQFEEVRNAALLQMMKALDVVGMTTTGAAKNMALVQNMGAKVVVVEEAAEALESHIVCCLSRHCQHLILIGDHQQLKPSPTVFKLAKDYGLDVSLFERMLANGVPLERLRTQHRMRPEISQLLKPHIYEDLDDHPKVSDYPDVKGMDKNVFFVTHSYMEESNDDLKSKSNEKEAEFLLAVCRYLLLQGYTKDEITILTGYSGQLFVFKKLLNYFPTCKGVRITLVDNYQGEENKIILLSLVRSNQDGKIGFLKTENRVNVALSRAKEGLFIIGNMDSLCKDDNSIWNKIKKVLVDQHSFGTGLSLRCQMHPDQVGLATKPEQFPPEGGCFKQFCNMPLKCGHMCARACHVTDRDHASKESSCKRPCERKCAAKEHNCESVCGKEPCPPCKKKIVRPLVPCEHEQQTLCYEDPAKVMCLTKCTARLDCGHACPRTCHVLDDPHHTKNKCLRDCEKECPMKHPCKGRCFQTPCPPCKEKVEKILPCGHQREVLCHVDVANVTCTKKCPKILPCNHPCKRKCNEPCGGCDVMVEKIIPQCGHPVKIACGQLAEKSLCKQECDTILPCGHRCALKCRENCEARKCQVRVRFDGVARCGHTVDIPCHIRSTKADWDPSELMLYCKRRCTAILDCEHPCTGTCSDCFQGRIHAPCNQPCRRPLVCGHLCKVPCAQNCPPCKDKCQYRCEHSECKKTCGEPCARCKEKCKRRCQHIDCRKRCFEECESKEKCDEPCRKKFSCGHFCVGLCGEVCPPCRQCKPEGVNFLDVIMMDEAEEDARFIYLPACKHVIEVDGMDTYMAIPQTEIGHRVCPICKTPILSSRRYKQEVDTAFEDVAAVRRKVFGMRANNAEVNRMIQMLMDPEKDAAGSVIKQIFNDQQYWKLFCDELGHEPYRTVPKNQQQQRKKNLSAMDAENVSNRIKLVEALAKLLRDSTAGDKRLVQNTSLDYLRARAMLLAESVMKRKNSLNDGVLKGFAAEIHRLRWIVQYFRLKEALHTPAAIQALQPAETVLFGIAFFSDQLEGDVRASLNDASKNETGLGVSDDERRMILRAIGLRQGHWYKCPNGHVYCITECGGAMQTGKCNECGAEIGGGSHRLLPTNAVASEMDGARHAAWSEANNMANFDPLDV